MWRRGEPINIPLKYKILIAVIFMLIASGVFINEGIKNSKARELTKKVAEKAELDKKKAEQDKITEEKKKVEEEKKAKEEAAKALDDKYQSAYNSFFDKKYKTAITLADEILAVDGSNYKAYNIKGIALCYSKKFDEGMSAIDKALEIKPDYAYGRFNKALAYELFGHYDEAIVWYDKAIELEKYKWSYYGKASIYGRNGDVAKTVEFLKIAIEMDPSIKQNAREEVDFANVRNSKEFQELVK